MCERVGNKQAPISDLIAAMKYTPFDEAFGVDLVTRDLTQVRALASNCPACILAALRLISDTDEPTVCEERFSWKEESKWWIEDYRHSLVGTPSGDAFFDRGEWDEARVKRFPVEVRA